MAITERQALKLPESVFELIEFLDCEYKCLALLERIRWSDGFICPRCNACKGYRIPEYKRIQCANCRHQASATSGTIFHRSHISLRKWFIAIILLTTDKTGLSAQRLHKSIEVSYKTALYMLKKLRSVMGIQNRLDSENPYIKKLESILKADNKKPVQGNFQLTMRESPEQAVLPSENDSPKAKNAMRDDSSNILSIIVPEISSGKTTVEFRSISKTVSGTLAGAVALCKHFFLGTFHRSSSKYLQLYFDEHAYKYRKSQCIETILAYFGACANTSVQRARQYIDSVLLANTKYAEPNSRVWYLQESEAGLYEAEDRSSRTLPESRSFILVCGNLASRAV